MYCGKLMHMLEFTISMDSHYTNRLKDFLDSGSTEAKVTKVALCIVALSVSLGIVVFAAGIGNAVQVFRMFKSSRKYDKKQIREAMNTLKRAHFIEYVSDKNGVTTVRITKKGESKLKAFAIDLITIQKPKHWDGKWRMVMFDLPIRFSKARNALRFQLKKLGFVQFQKSVWIYPYPCIDEILFILDYYKVGKYVEILEVSSITNDQKLKKYFNLS